jgi:hypothetical protein
VPAKCAFEAPAVVAGLDDIAVMGDTVEQGGSHFRITEHNRPLAEGEVGHDDGTGAFVKLVDQVPGFASET